jgi:pyrimidine-nucleoside phosphorylase
LKGRGPEDFNSLCRELAAEMFVLGRAAINPDAGRELYDKMIQSGAALEKMRQIIAAQEGDARVLDDYDLLPRASHTHTVSASETGYIQAIDTEAIGHASMLLGAGRARLDTAIDLGVGLIVEAKIGDKIEQGQPLVTLHFNEEDRVEDAAIDIRNAYTIGEHNVAPPQLIKAVMR